MKTEYQLVVKMPSGYRHIYPKRDWEHADKGMQDMRRDMKRGIYYENAELFIETRQVGGWARIDWPDE